MPCLSVVIIARDEAANIREALASVAWADERVVVDAGSIDETIQIAQEAGARVETRRWEGYAAQKNHATALAANDWVLSLDADERVTPALADEIRALLASSPSAHGYRIPRVTRYLGRWIRSTDWYPDSQLRLYDRRHARWKEVLVHESVALDGPPGRLRGELEHDPYRNIAHHLETVDRYTTLAAEQMRRDGRRAGVSDLALQAPAAFIRNYFLRGGIRDGATGLLVSTLNSYSVFLKFAKLWELQQRGQGRS